MAISPVSAVTYGSNYNSINFGNKKSKENHKKGISIPVSHKLAVPLAATVLAMAPMASDAKNKVFQAEKTNNIEMLDNITDNGKIIDKKHFVNQIGNASDENPAFEHVTIKLINSKGNNNTFDKILYETELHDRSISFNAVNTENYLTGFSDITYELISDDGKKGPSFNMKSVNLGNQDIPSILPADQMDYIEAAINSSNNKSDIKIHKYTRGLRHSGSHIENVSKGNIMKGAVTESEEVLGKLAGTTEVETNEGQYIVSYYSKDDNMDDAEFVTVKRDDGPELRLISVEIDNAVINPNSSNPVKLRYGYVVTSDGKNLYTLFDDNLIAPMLEIFKNSALDNAKKHVSFFESKSNYMTTTKGVIMHIADVDE